MYLHLPAASGGARLLAAGLVGLSLGGCITQSYAVRTYAERKPVAIRIANATYQVLDRPDLGKLLVASDTALATDEHGRARTQAVALRFLSDAGRGLCRLSDGTSAARPYAEVIYRCEKVAAAPVTMPAVAAPAVTRTARDSSARADTTFSLRMNRL